MNTHSYHPSYLLVRDGSGDTDFILEMKGLKVDIALLPVGGTYTMDAKEAAKAAAAINPRIAISMHWGDNV